VERTAHRSGHGSDMAVGLLEVQHGARQAGGVGERSEVCWIWMGERALAVGRQRRVITRKQARWDAEHYDRNH
jgi:hypothetical protein